MRQKNILWIVAAATVALLGGLWWRQQNSAALAALPPEVAQAMAMVQAKGCAACHSHDGAAGIGPSWRGSWGKVREFTGGGSAVFDAAYLRESISAPAAQLVQGFPNLMLPVGLSEDELQQLELLLRYLAEPNSGVAAADG
ncbi:MAG: hypothetical protein LBE21_04255 [Pseudomonadales bacterium]|jgi:cytochrome c oxidase subunit 2|nr:hypothetical protein [Pseudomonadales bacterium]